MALCEVALSYGSDLLSEEMKIGMEFYIHHIFFSHFFQRLVAQAAAL